MWITAVNVKSLGMACLYLVTAVENFLGISTEEEILASQPGSSYFLYCWLPSGRLFPPITTRYVLPRPWACLEIFSLHPLQKKLSTHLQGVCDTVEVSLQRCHTSTRRKGQQWSGCSLHSWFILKECSASGCRNRSTVAVRRP